MSRDLTQKYLKSILDYDPETGIFVWKIANSNRIKIGDTAGHSCSAGYLQLSIEGKHYYCHRLAWLYIYGKWPRKFIDHTNGNRCDNKINNLREANDSQNSMNQKKPIVNTSGFKGVCFDEMRKKKKYYSQIKKNQKNYFLGYFFTAEEAHEAYCKKGGELHGEFFNNGVVKTNKGEKNYE